MPTTTKRSQRKPATDAVKRPRGRPRVYPVGESPAELRRAAAAARRTLAAGPLNDEGEPYEAVPENCTPLDFLEGVMRGRYKPDALRLRAAVGAAQYVHTPLKDGGKKDAAKRQATKVAAGKYAPGSAPLRVVK